MRVLSNQCNPTFSAKLLAQWRCNSAMDGSFKSVSVAQLEKCDLHFVENFIEKVDSIKIKDKNTKDIFASTIKTAREILKSENPLLERVKILFAIYNNKPCGVLVANIPKYSSDGEGIEYSSRHNSAKNETELDWLVTWNVEGSGKIKGLGKALIGEYFKTLKKDKFRDVFVRSELPENSYAQAFYESVGFEQLGDKRKRFERRTTKNSIVEDYTYSSDMIVPMIIVKKKSSEVARDLAEKMCRREFVKNSVPADELMYI